MGEKEKTEISFPDTNTGLISPELSLIKLFETRVLAIMTRFARTQPGLILPGNSET